MRKYIAINMSTATNIKNTYDEAVVEAKQKTMEGKLPQVYGVFELIAVTEVPVPDIKIVKVD